MPPVALLRLNQTAVCVFIRTEFEADRLAIAIILRGKFFGASNRVANRRPGTPGQNKNHRK
jgi:hypothetical protein